MSTGFTNVHILKTGQHKNDHSHTVLFFNANMLSFDTCSNNNLIDAV